MPDRAPGVAEIPLDACSPVWPFPSSSVLLHRVRKARAVRKPRRFRVPHAKDLFLPINVLQTQRDDFAGSQAVSGQQHQKGVIPSANRRAILTSRFHDGLNLLGTQRRRNLLIVMDPWSDHGTTQIEGGS